MEGWSASPAVAYLSQQRRSLGDEPDAEAAEDLNALVETLALDAPVDGMLLLDDPYDHPKKSVYKRARSFQLGGSQNP